MQQSGQWAAVSVHRRKAAAAPTDEGYRRPSNSYPPGGGRLAGAEV